MHPKDAVSVQQIKRIEEAAIQRYGIPSIVLMENAGRCVAQEVRRLLKTRKAKHIIVVCGTGSNGGDGLVTARHLLISGCEVDIYLVGKGNDLKGDAALNYQVLKKAGLFIHEISGFNETDVEKIKKADIVVDAIFGVGISRTVREPFSQVIETLNHHAVRIVSVDVPSGLDAATGKVYGTCIKAGRTVTFTLPKIGFFENEGPAHVGKLIVREVGIPPQVVQSVL